MRRWNKKGLQPNYYLETADDDRRPVQVDQVPNDIMTFETSTFDTSVPAGIFDFPDWCDATAGKCSIASTCRAVGAGGA